MQLSDMSIQVMLPNKSLAASCTFMRSIISMCPLMRLQIMCPRKVLCADITHMLRRLLLQLREKGSGVWMVDSDVLLHFLLGTEAEVYSRAAGKRAKVWLLMAGDMAVAASEAREAVVKIRTGVSRTLVPAYSVVLRQLRFLG